MKPFKSIYFIAIASLITVAKSSAQGWLRVTSPTYAEMMAGFKNPPLQYAQTMDFGLGENLTPERIVQDIDAVYKQGIMSISIEANYGSPQPYLSQGYMELVKIVVQELKKTRHAFVDNRRRQIS